MAITLSVFAGSGASAILYSLPPILAAMAAFFGGGERGELIAKLASTLPLLGIMAGGFCSGAIIQRGGIRRMQIFTLIGFGLLGSIGLVINDAFLLLSTRTLMGFCVGVLLTCCTALITAHYNDEQQAAMAGKLISVGSVLGVCGILVAGAIASISWRAPFWMHAVWALALLIPAILMPETKLAAKEPPGLRAVTLGLWPMALLFLLAILFNVFVNLPTVQLAFLMAAAGAGSPGIVAAVFGGSSLAAAGAAGVYGRLEVRFGAMAMAMGGLLILTVATFVLWFAGSVLWFAVAALLCGVGVGFVMPALWSVVMRLSPPHLVTYALGMLTAAFYLGAAIAPIVLLPLRAGFGLQGQYGPASAMLLVLALVSPLLLPRSARRRTGASATA